MSMGIIKSGEYNKVAGLAEGGDLPSLWAYIKNKIETYFSIFFHDDDLRIFNEDGDIEIGEPNDENAHVTHILNDCNMEHELTVNGDVGVGGSIGIEGDMSVSGEIDQVGNLANLTTDAKTNLVSAINEVDGHADDNAEAIGNLSNLTTTAKTDIVSAINEVDGHADDNADAIGNLSNLTTTEKTDLVSAINEVNAKKIEIALTDLSSFFTSKAGGGVYLDTIIGQVKLSPYMGYFSLTVSAGYENSLGKTVSFRLRATASEEFYNAAKQALGSKFENAQVGSSIGASSSVFIRAIGSTAKDIVFGTATLSIVKLSGSTAQGTIMFSGTVGVCMVSGTQDSSIGTGQVAVFY